MYSKESMSIKAIYNLEIPIRILGTTPGEDLQEIIKDLIIILICFKI